MRTFNPQTWVQFPPAGLKMTNKINTEGLPWAEQITILRKLCKNFHGIDNCRNCPNCAHFEQIDNDGYPSCDKCHKDVKERDLYGIKLGKIVYNFCNLCFEYVVDRLNHSVQSYLKEDSHYEQNERGARKCKRRQEK